MYPGLIVVVHVGFIDDGAPFVLPMIGKMGQYDGNPYAMYIHGIPPFIHQKLTSGYVSSRLNRLMKSEDEKDHPRVCVTGSRGSHPQFPSH